MCFDNVRNPVKLMYIFSIMKNFILPYSQNFSAVDFFHSQALNRWRCYPVGYNLLEKNFMIRFLFKLLAHDCGIFRYIPGVTSQKLHLLWIIDYY